MSRDLAGANDASAYDLPAASFDAERVCVKQGAPSGELPRRYWHPIAAASELRDLPLAVRAKSEIVPPPNPG